MYAHTHTIPQVNHHKKPDVALFDFTSIHQAEYAAKVIRRGGKDLYLCLIGDALLEVSTYNQSVCEWAGMHAVAGGYTIMKFVWISS